MVGNSKKKIEILKEDIALLEEYVRDLFSFTPIGIIIVSPKGVILETNPALEKIVESDTYSLIGEPVEKVIPKDIYKETVREGEISGRKVILKKSRGDDIPVNIFSKERKTSEGETAGYLFALLDATEMERMNEEIEESKKVLEVRVAARTQELKEMAENLETQVKLRTTELEDKLRELEKMNKLMVGRELKMIEVKEKLSRAEEEIIRLKGEKEPAFDKNNPDK